MRWKRDVRALWGSETFTCPVSIRVDLFEWKKNADPDNYLKSVLDALAGAAFWDDSCATVREATVAAWGDGKGDVRTRGFTVTIRAAHQGV